MSFSKSVSSTWSDGGAGPYDCVKEISEDYIRKLGAHLKRCALVDFVTERRIEALDELCKVPMR